MRLFVAVALGLMLALPVYAVQLEVGPPVSGPEPVYPVSPDVSCTSSMGASVFDSQVGITGGFGPQAPCIPGGPGTPGDLIGLSYKVTSCGDGFVTTSRVRFNIANPGELYYHAIYRDGGGIPFDACGMECGVANGGAMLSIVGTGPTWETYDWTADGCPCLTFSGEALFTSYIYSVASWFIARDAGVVVQGEAFGNLSGNHGDWQDLFNFGFGNPYAVEYDVSDQCGGVPVEPSTWGAMKNLYK